jgi:hypothetical protein
MIYLIIENYNIELYWIFYSRRCESYKLRFHFIESKSVKVVIYIEYV